MKKIICHPAFLGISGILLILSCNQTKMNESNQADPDTMKNNTQKSISPEPDAGAVSTGDTVYIQPSTSEVSKRMTIRPNHHIVFLLANTGKNQLMAKVAPDEKGGNVRITQIIIPDGNADGPFGASIARILIQHGNYAIVVGQNLMAGHPYTGTFTFSYSTVPM